MIVPTPNAPCLAHEPRNSPTCVLAVAVWLKLNRKYFNEGTAKEACDRFKVRAKQLSRVLNREEILGWYTVKETQGHRDSNHCTRTSSPKKEGQYLKEDNLHQQHTSHGAYGKKPL